MMRLEQIPLRPTAAQSTLQSSASSSVNQQINRLHVVEWASHCHGFWYNVALIVPAALFVAFLASQARKSLTKLSYGRSYIMISYYGLLWAVSVFNLLWCVFQYWGCTPGKELNWNLLTLFTTSGLLFLEVSLVAFLLQGNQVSGLDALTRTFTISGMVIALDLILKCIYVFVLGIPLFMDSGNGVNRVKWGLWATHKFLLTAVYGTIFFMHHSKWKERLPARPMFYRYVMCMLSLNVVGLLSCGILACGGAFGIWLFNLSVICYHALYLPLLYITFLADFFQEEDLNLESAYYSEMKDAGFFDSDWD